MTDVDDALWENFHRLVNMTSRELEDWLRVEASGEDTEALPDQAGPSLGRRVLEILGKRRTDLTPDDGAVISLVTDRIVAERGVDPEPTAGQEAWRHRLMRIGHDPLKPVG